MKKINDLKTNKVFAALGGGGISSALRRAVAELRHYHPFVRRRKAAAEDENGVFVSAVVCTYDRPKKLLTAVRTLLEQTLPQNEYEAIVVMSGKRLPNYAAEELKKLNIKIVYEASPGLSAARNTGAKAAKGNCVIYIDDDAEAAPDLIEVTRDAFMRHKRAGAIGGRILLKTKPDIVLPGHEDLWSQFDVGYKKYREVKRQYEFPFGANFAVRKSALAAVGGFDESYGRNGSDYGGGEETALCFKLLRRGYRIGIEPRSLVLHNVDAERFTRVHIKNTIAAGIMTTHRLYLSGYGSSDWNEDYAKSRVSIAEKELARLRKAGAGELEIFYKECERDGFLRLIEKIREEEKIRKEKIRKEKIRKKEKGG